MARRATSINRAYVSGGSSSGSAVAVAAGLVAFALGTDTAGSGRVPAAFNHLVGLQADQGPLEHARPGAGLPHARLHHRLHRRRRRRARWSTRWSPASTPADPYSAPLRRPCRSAARRIGVPRRDQRVWFGDRRVRMPLRPRARARSAAWARRSSRSTSRRCWRPRSCSTAAPGSPSAPPRMARILRRAIPTRSTRPCARSSSRALDVSAVELFNGIYRLAELQARTPRRCGTAIDVLLLPTTAHDLSRRARCWPRRSR